MWVSTPAESSLCLLSLCSIWLSQITLGLFTHQLPPLYLRGRYSADVHHYRHRFRFQYRLEQNGVQALRQLNDTILSPGMATGTIEDLTIIHCYPMRYIASTLKWDQIFDTLHSGNSEFSGHRIRWTFQSGRCSRARQVLRRARPQRISLGAPDYRVLLSLSGSRFVVGPLVDHLEIRDGVLNDRDIWDVEIASRWKIGRAHV